MNNKISYKANFKRLNILAVISLIVSTYLISYGLKYLGLYPAGNVIGKWLFCYPSILLGVFILIIVVILYLINYDKYIIITDEMFYYSAGRNKFKVFWSDIVIYEKTEKKKPVNITFSDGKNYGNIDIAFFPKITDISFNLKRLKKSKAKSH